MSGIRQLVRAELCCKVRLSEYRPWCFALVSTASKPQSKYLDQRAVFLAETSLPNPCTHAPTHTCTEQQSGVSEAWLTVLCRNPTGVVGAGLQKYQLFNKKRPPGLRRERDTSGKEGTK